MSEDDDADDLLEALADKASTFGCLEVHEAECPAPGGLCECSPIVLGVAKGGEA